MNLPSGWAWRLLTILAILFDAGIGGTWLGTQMELGLPHWWGLLGAILAGLAVYGGVELAVHGDRKGIFVALCGILPSVAFAHQYFDARGHGLLLAAILAGFPPGIAVLGGIVAASAKATESANDAAHAQRLRQQRLEDQQRRRQQQLEDEERRRQQQLEDEERAYRRQEAAKAAARNAEREQRQAELQAQVALAQAEAEAAKAREAEELRKAREAMAAQKAQKARKAAKARKAESAVSPVDDSDKSGADDSDKSASNKSTANQSAADDSGKSAVDKSAVIRKPIQSKKDMVFELLDCDSDISNKALAGQVGIGDSTARSYRAQWRKGKAAMNGHGG